MSFNIFLYNRNGWKKMGRTVYAWKNIAVTERNILNFLKLLDTQQDCFLFIVCQYKKRKKWWFKDLTIKYGLLGIGKNPEEFRLWPVILQHSLCVFVGDHGKN